MTVPLAPVDAASLRRAVESLEAGGVVAFPTETYYGLAVDPFNQDAAFSVTYLQRSSR